MSDQLEPEAARAALDELTRRLRTSEAAAAVLRAHLGRVAALLDGWEGLHPNVLRAATVARTVPGEHDAGAAFLGHLARIEAALQGRGVAGAGDRYPMAADQPAQIDCRMARCRFHRAGTCTNVSPAISLHEDGHAYCWSREERA